MQANAQQCQKCGVTHAMPSDPYDNCPVCGGALVDVQAIATLQELASLVGAYEPTEKSIARRLYKDTECGICFWASIPEIGVSGYVEGWNGQCPPHTMRLGEFTAEQFWSAVEIADREGCEIFDEVHANDEEI